MSITLDTDDGFEFVDRGEFDNDDQWECDWCGEVPEILYEYPPYTGPCFCCDEHFEKYYERHGSKRWKGIHD